MTTTDLTAPDVCSGTGERATVIRLRRAEGPIELLSDDWSEFTGPQVWAQARSTLLAWSRTAPGDGSVDKTDFQVVFADGARYSGCFGLTSTDVDLPGHIRGHLRYVASDPHRLFDPCDVRDAQAFLDGYQLGD